MPDAAMTVKPDANGWVAVDLPSLGADVDQALSQKRDVLGTAAVFYDVDGNKLTGKASIKLRDTKTYSIEYYLPETAQAKNEFRADGKRAIQLENYKWVPVAEAKPATDPTTWTKRFAANQFNAVVFGGHGWAEVIDQLRKGDGGYTTMVQSKTSQLDGKSRKVFRVLATRADKTEFEAVFDAEQHLPLTVRYNEPGKDGVVNKVLWTCKWQAGGAHDAKSFVIPNPLPKPSAKV